MSWSAHNDLAVISEYSRRCTGLLRGDLVHESRRDHEKVRQKCRYIYIYRLSGKKFSFLRVYEWLSSCYFKAMAAPNTSNTGKPVRDKWGQALDPAGFQAFPNLLLTQQQTLGLSNTDLVVLLHLNRRWWTRDEDPFPRPARIATQMGIHRRSVERCLKRLEEKGLIKRPGPRQTASGRIVWPISIRPLAEYLSQIARHLPYEAQSNYTGSRPKETAHEQSE